MESRGAVQGWSGAQETSNALGFTVGLRNQQKSFVSLAKRLLLTLSLRMTLSVTCLGEMAIGQIGFVIQILQKPTVPHFVLILRKVTLNVMLECRDGSDSGSVSSPPPLFLRAL